MELASILEVRPEVAQAIREGRPVVALESTLIAHGLPWPLNLQTARRRRRWSSGRGGAGDHRRLGRQADRRA